MRMLESLKEEVLAANVDIERQSLAKLTWGNVSGIDRERGLVVIKPSGVPYSKLKIADMVVVDLDNVRVEGFNMLVTEFARQVGASTLMKGLRAISDFDYEFQMAQINKGLAPEIETVYLPASAKYSFLSSSGVREIAVWGGSVDDWVPATVVEAFRHMVGTYHEED